jgi:hypothetical protein
VKIRKKGVEAFRRFKNERQHVHSKRPEKKRPRHSPGSGIR